MRVWLVSERGRWDVHFSYFDYFGRVVWQSHGSSCVPGYPRARGSTVEVVGGREGEALTGVALGGVSSNVNP